MRYLMAFAMLFAVLLAPAMPARAALDTNAVCAFYANETYRCELWDDIANLNRRDRNYVSVGVFIVQVPGDFPNVVMFNGADEIALRRTFNALFVRELFLSPLSRRRSQFFEDDRSLNLIEAWPGAASSLFAATSVHMFSRAFGGPYSDLTSRAATLALDLRFDPVPSNGVY